MEVCSKPSCSAQDGAVTPTVAVATRTGSSPSTPVWLGVGSRSLHHTTIEELLATEGYLGREGLFSLGMWFLRGHPGHSRLSYTPGLTVITEWS